MKYILLALAALVGVMGLSFLVTGLIRKRIQHKPSKASHILISIVAGLLAFCIICMIDLNIYYHADQDVLSILGEPYGAEISEIDCGYFIDGGGEDTALIFYPEAKVECEAYLPMLKKLAKNGIDCFLLKMPLRIAFFDKNAADRVIDRYTYKNWLVSGHSMGGTVAADYAVSHADSIDGVILLAAIPHDPLPNDIPLLSIYGSEDQLFDRNAYDKAKADFPDDTTEFIIPGGNHSQFGNYGIQSGDGEATVSHKIQQNDTVDEILKFIEKHY